MAGHHMVFDVVRSPLNDSVLGYLNSILHHHRVHLEKVKTKIDIQYYTMV